MTGGRVADDDVLAPVLGAEGNGFFFDVLRAAGAAPDATREECLVR